jgi:uncharacterized RDD family membrane protein YckC
VPFYVVYLILNTILYSIFSPSLADLLENPTSSVFWPGFISAVIAFGGFAVYDYMLHSKDGQTFGKKAMKIRLVGVGGATPDSNALMKRAAVYPGVLALYGLSWFGWIAALFGLLVAILILVDKPLQQGLHDKIAGTLVVKAPR